MVGSSQLLHDFETNICQIIEVENKIIFKKALNAVEEMTLTKQEAINLLSEVINLIK